MNPIQDLKHRLDTLDLWEENRTINRNEYIALKGKIDTNLYFVLSGSLRVFIVDNSEELTIRFGYQNSFITALDSFISGIPTDYYIQAIKKTTLKIISKQNYYNFIQSSAENSTLWHNIMEQLIYQQMEREIDILTTSPVDRYKRVLKRSPQLFQEIPHKYIASYLRMTPETLSRIKKY